MTDVDVTVILIGIPRAISVEAIQVVVRRSFAVTLDLAPMIRWVIALQLVID